MAHPKLYRTSQDLWRSVAKPLMTAGLCASLLCPAELAVAGVRPASGTPRRAEASAGLTPEQRTLHVLNRFSFGPTPGGAKLIEQEGVDAWFAQQLHPDRIPDADLERRLAQFPAMQLTQAELVERFPTPGMLRQYNRGGLVLPEDSTERVIYADAALNYEEKREMRAAAKEASSPSGQSRLPGAAQAVAGSGTEAPKPAGTQAAAPVVRRPGPGMSKDAENTAPSPGDRESMLALPAEARMQRLLALSPDQMVALQASLKGPALERLYAGLSPAQVEQVAAMRSPERVVGSEALTVRLLRDVYSQRQLQAVMTDFWLNHFNVYLRKNQNEPYLLPAYEREAVLPNALGRFEDLLVATAKSPAMLVYLDNWESIGPNSRAAQRSQVTPLRQAGLPGNQAAKAPKGINENYARELMELHTLGVKGGYSQQDVIEVAKCFTGWTIDRPNQGGEFLFNPNRHEPGDKTVLGHVIHEGGMNEGLEVLHLLATSPATAHFVSLKLAERFVSDDPPPALVERMSATFLKSNGDIKAVLTTLYRSPEFFSPQVYRAKVKTPLEFVASALRATDADVSNPLPLVQAMDRLGMPIYGMQTPNGYSWQAENWVSSNALLTRMNFALVLSGNRLGGTRLDWPALLGEATGATGGIDSATEQDLELVLLGQPAAPQTREAALSQAHTPGVQQQAEQSFRKTPHSLGGNSPTEAGESPMLRIKGKGFPPSAEAPGTPLATTAGLLLGSPDFQRR